MAASHLLVLLGLSVKWASWLMTSLWNLFFFAVSFATHSLSKVLLLLRQSTWLWVCITLKQIFDFSTRQEIWLISNTIIVIIVTDSKIIGWANFSYVIEIRDRRSPILILHSTSKYPYILWHLLPIEPLTKHELLGLWRSSCKLQIECLISIGWTHVGFEFIFVEGKLHWRLLLERFFGHF